MAQLNWSPAYALETVNLTGVFVQGVYVIWHGGTPSRVVRVGQGDVSARLAAHRQDSAILAHRRNGTLYAKWALVSAADRDGVEAFLAKRFPPLVGDRFPNCTPIAVNDPW